MKVRIEVVETAGKQIGIHGRQLEAAVAQIDRSVERRRVLLPLRAEPVLDGWLRGEDALLQIKQRAFECGSETGDHGVPAKTNAAF